MICSYFRGVCISDLIPFYMGRLFRQTKASDDVLSRVSTAPTSLLLGSYTLSCLNINATYILSAHSHGGARNFELGVAS